MGAGFTKYDDWKTTEPSSSEPTTEWEQAQAQVEKVTELLELTPDKNKLAWQGMGHKARSRWERRNHRLSVILDYWANIVDSNRCPGCGQYSEGGRVHNTAICRIDARCDL